MSGVISSKKKSRPTATRGPDDHDNDSGGYGVVSFGDLIPTDRLTADLNIFKVRQDLRRGELGILNRIKSIVVDVERFRQFRALFPSLPVFANLRCGKWYVPPSLDPCVGFNDIPTPTLVDCYFKSTDGHPGTWALSWSRVNTHVIQHASIPTFVKIWPEVLYILKARNQLPSTQALPDPPASLLHCCLPLRGALLVDATRKGKRFPDSFSRTIPIWCAAATVAIATMAGACACSCGGTGMVQSKAYVAGGCSGDTYAAPSSSSSGTTAPCPCLSALSRALHLPPWVSPSERDMVLRALPRLAALFARHTRAQRQQLCATAACEVLPPALRPVSASATASVPTSASASETPESTVSSPAPFSELFFPSSSASAPPSSSPASPLLHPSSPLWRPRTLRPVWLQAQDARGTVAALNDNLLRWLELAVAHGLTVRMPMQGAEELTAGAGELEKENNGEDTSSSFLSPRWCVAPRPPAPVLSAAMAVLRRIVARYSLGALFPVDRHHFHRLHCAVRDMQREYSPVDDSMQSVVESVDAVAVCAAVVDALGALSLLEWSALVLYSASVPEAEGGTNGSVRADSNIYTPYPQSGHPPTPSTAMVAGVAKSKGRIASEDTQTDTEAQVDGRADMFARAYIDPFCRVATAATSAVTHTYAHTHTHNTLLQQALARLSREQRAHQHCAQHSSGNIPSLAHDLCTQTSAGAGSTSVERGVCGSTGHGARAASTPAGECSAKCTDTPIPSPVHAQGRDSWTYVQGAGDDEESWAAQLTPSLLCRHAEWLLAARDNEECLERVRAVLTEGGGADGVGTVVSVDASEGAGGSAHVCALPADMMWGAATSTNDTVTARAAVPTTTSATVAASAPASVSGPARVWPRVWVCERAHVAEAAAVAAAAVSQVRASSSGSSLYSSNNGGPGHDVTSDSVDGHGDGDARVRVFLCGEDINAGWAYQHQDAHVRAHTRTHISTNPAAEVATQLTVDTVADAPVASLSENTVATTASLFASACGTPVLCCGAPVGGGKKTKLGLVKHAGLLMAAAALAPTPVAREYADHASMTGSTRAEFFVVVCDSMEVGVAVATLISLAATASLDTHSESSMGTNSTISTPLWAHTCAHDLSLQPLLQLVYGCKNAAGTAIPLATTVTTAAPEAVAAVASGANPDVSGVVEADVVGSAHEHAEFGTSTLVYVPYEVPATTTHPRMRYSKEEVRQRVSAVLASTGGDVFPARTLAQQLNRVFCSAL